MIRDAEVLCDLLMMMISGGHRTGGAFGNSAARLDPSPYSLAASVTNEQHLSFPDTVRHNELLMRVTR